MNVFMPCESIVESVQALDDARLRKQIIECKVLLEGAIAYQNGEKPKGYFKHPVAQHYKDCPLFIAIYGLECCTEYKIRFQKIHKYEGIFFNLCCDKMFKNDLTFVPPLYAEGRKDTPECIRTTDPEKVYDLFKQKFIKKWKSDAEKGRPPKWTNRGMPSWAKQEKQPKGITSECENCVFYDEDIDNQPCCSCNDFSNFEQYHPTEKGGGE